MISQSLESKPSEDQHRTVLTGTVDLGSSCQGRGHRWHCQLDNAKFNLKLQSQARESYLSSSTRRPGGSESLRPRAGAGRLGI